MTTTTSELTTARSALQTRLNKITEHFCCPTNTSAGVPADLDIRKTCRSCKAQFASRSALFRHLRAQRHAVLGTNPVKNDAEKLVRQIAGVVDEAPKILEAVRTAFEAGPPGRLANGFLETGESAIWLVAAASVLAPCEDIHNALKLLSAIPGVFGGADGPPESILLTGLWKQPVHLLFDGMGPLPYHTALEMAQALESHITVTALLQLPANYSGEMCPIHLCESFWCASSADSLDLEATKCGHAACLLGWQRWIHEQCFDQGRTLGGAGVPVACMQCDTALCYEDVRRLTRRDPALMAALERKTVEAAIGQMDDFTWCPRCSSGGWCSATPDVKLTLGLRSKGDDVSVTATLRVAPMCKRCECTNCSYAFCKECQGNADEHMQGGMWLPCGQVASVLHSKWCKENEHRIKSCPKCGLLTEHNGGCSHMRCRCGYEWCWLCSRRYQGRYVSLTGRPGQKCSCPPLAEGEASGS